MKNKGLTLIEVLVALAILAIALTAIIKATTQNIKDNVYLQQKTIATWVASNVMNEIRLGLLKAPSAPGEIEDETEMLNLTWKYKANITATANQHIQRVNVTVEGKNEQPLANLESYIYVQQ